MDTLPNESLWKISSFMTVYDNVLLSSTCSGLRTTTRTYLSYSFDYNYKVQMTLYASAKYDIKKRSVFLLTLNKIRQVENAYIHVYCWLLEEFIQDKKDHRLYYWYLTILRWKFLPLLDINYVINNGWCKGKWKKGGIIICMFTSRRDKLHKLQKSNYCEYVKKRIIDLCVHLGIKYNIYILPTSMRISIY